MTPRRTLLAFVFAAFAVWAPPEVARAQMSDAQIQQAVVGRWEWQDSSSGQQISYQLTLVGDGSFAFTSWMGTYQVTSTGLWGVQGGWLGFKATWSSSLDPTGAPIGVGPVQILEVGPDFIRTPAGIARRTG